MKSLKNLIDLNLPKINLIDVGAMLSTDGSRYSKLLENDLVDVIGFEPNDIQWLKLENKKNIKYLNYCIGNGDKKILNITRYPGCTSLFEPNTEIINLFNGISAEEKGNFEVIDKQKVQTHKLEDVKEITKADVIKIDTQGSELEILESYSKKIKDVLVIEAEVEFVKIYKNQPLFSDVNNFLNKNGFILHKLIDIGGRPFRPWKIKDNPAYPMSQLLWADAVFIRDFSKIGKFSDIELLKTLLILHDMYDSYDLCHFLLKEYDNRMKTDFSKKYSSLVLKSDLELKFMNLRLDIDRTSNK